MSLSNILISTSTTVNSLTISLANFCASPQFTNLILQSFKTFDFDLLSVATYSSPESSFSCSPRPPPHTSRRILDSTSRVWPQGLLMRIYNYVALSRTLNLLANRVATCRMYDEMPVLAAPLPECRGCARHDASVARAREATCSDETCCQCRLQA